MVAIITKRSHDARGDFGIGIKQRTVWQLKFNALVVNSVEAVAELATFGAALHLNHLRGFIGYLVCGLLCLGTNINTLEIDVVDCDLWLRIYRRELEKSEFVRCTNFSLVLSKAEGVSTESMHRAKWTTLWLENLVVPLLATSHELEHPAIIYLMWRNCRVVLTRLPAIVVNLKRIATAVSLNEKQCTIINCNWRHLPVSRCVISVNVRINE